MIGVVAIIAARMRRDEIAHPLDTSDESPVELSADERADAAARPLPVSDEVCAPA